MYISYVQNSKYESPRAIAMSNVLATKYPWITPLDLAPFHSALTLV